MRTITLLILAVSTATILSQNCGGPNFLSTPWNIDILDNTNAFHVVTAADGYTFCSYAVNDETCCTPATVNGFQTKADELVATLEILAGTRDAYFINRRGDILQLKDELTTISAAVTSGLEAENLSAENAALIALSTEFGDLATALTTNFATLKEDFTTYQKARATCLQTIVQTQAAAWCLACSDLTSATGVDTTAETVAFDTTLVTRLSGSCYPYIQSSATQSEIVSLYNIRSALADLAAGLEKIANNDATGATELADAATEIDQVSNSVTAAEIPVEIPTSCTSAACQWLEDSAFTNAALQNSAIIMGGTEAVISFVLPTTRILGEGSGRNLQVTGWNPADNVAGITVTFEENPASIDNDANSAIRNDVVACAIAGLAFLL